MSRFKLAFLGPLLIKCDDSLVRIDRRKAIALLAYLAVNNQQYSRDTLATMFWPDFDGNQGRAALRRTLCALKAVFGDCPSVRCTIILQMRCAHCALDP